MVIRVRGGLTAIAVAVAVVVLVAALPAPALAGGPSAKQIRAAVAHAERSSSLWATINICSSRGKGRGGELGVRGQMPALGFSSTMRMTIQLGSWSEKHKRFVPIDGPTATKSLSLASSSSGMEQGGMAFGFTGSAGLLNATIDFSWSRGGRLLAQTSSPTTAGHRDADYSRPAHFSASQCRLG
jgi:hypothetical protein